MSIPKKSRYYYERIAFDLKDALRLKKNAIFTGQKAVDAVMDMISNVSKSFDRRIEKKEYTYTASARYKTRLFEIWETIKAIRMSSVQRVPLFEAFREVEMKVNSRLPFVEGENQGGVMKTQRELLDFRKEVHEYLSKNISNIDGVTELKHRLKMIVSRFRSMDAHNLHGKSLVELKTIDSKAYRVLFFEMAGELEKELNNELRFLESLSSSELKLRNTRPNGDLDSKSQDSGSLEVGESAALKR